MPSSERMSECVNEYANEYANECATIAASLRTGSPRVGTPRGPASSRGEALAACGETRGRNERADTRCFMNFS
ncbi:hypothetical protein [Paraburkholderia susongensis]|uniref:hypothetical protein n=1 Tax=Paraburkholderia susongensis TaxID=1515439 RepID=UPI00117C62C9|nr:hypothetical protein [Paraburkholderia susongensis]